MSLKRTQSPFLPLFLQLLTELPSQARQARVLKDRKPGQQKGSGEKAQPLWNRGCWRLKASEGLTSTQAACQLTKAV